ncbi:hypothetical protein ANTPLA_LOCUS1644 [Anthophora plagiata]
MREEGAREEQLWGRPRGKGSHFGSSITCLLYYTGLRRLQQRLFALAKYNKARGSQTRPRSVQPFQLTLVRGEMCTMGTNEETQLSTYDTSDRFGLVLARMAVSLAEFYVNLTRTAIYREPLLASRAISASPMPAR